MPAQGQSSTNGKNLSSTHLSLTIIGLTIFVAIYLYRETAFEALSSLAAAMRPEATVLLLGISALALVVQLFRQKRSTKIVVREVENRDRQILFHRDRNEKIVESELRYKSLFEDAMKAATLDLEKLNEDLKEKQAKLAEEVEGHKKTETALRESELRWMKLVEKNPEAIVITVQGVIAYANPAGLQMLGVVELDALRGMSLARFLPDELQGEISKRISLGASNEIHEPMEFDIQGLDLGFRTVELHAVPAVFRGKQASQNVFRDITQRKKSEKAVQLYTERLHAMVEIERMMLVSGEVHQIGSETLTRIGNLVGIDCGMIIEFNEATGRVDMIASEGIDDVSAAIDSCPTRKQSWDWTVEVVSSSTNQSDQSDMHRSLSEWLDSLGATSFVFLPLAAGDEALGAMILATRDEKGLDGVVDDSIREFADLLALGIKQDRIMEERTNYELEILSAKEHAEELVRLKSVFLTNMSHEIRTPLTSIIGFAQILSEEMESEHIEFLGLIEESGKRLLGTINSVLDLARLESNSVNIKTETVDVADTINEAAAMLQSLSIKRGITLNTENTSKPLLAEVDKSALDRILNNLIGNAIKFTDKGGVTVRLSSREDSYVVEVEDTGVGISEQFLPYIFDDFKQESYGASRSYEGSGMGLSITRKLVDVMAGTIEVQSGKNKGTIFRVILPMKRTGEPKNRGMDAIIPEVEELVRTSRPPSVGPSMLPGDKTTSRAKSISGQGTRNS